MALPALLRDTLSIPVVGLVIVFYNHYLAFRGIQKLRVVIPSEETQSEQAPNLVAPGSPSPVLEK